MSSVSLEKPDYYKLLRLESLALFSSSHQAQPCPGRWCLTVYSGVASTLTLVPPLPSTCSLPSHLRLHTLAKCSFKTENPITFLRDLKKNLLVTPLQNFSVNPALLPVSAGGHIGLLQYGCHLNLRHQFKSLFAQG